MPLVSSENETEVYGESQWTTPSNPTLNYSERARRRIELHYATKELQYNQPRVHDEFLSILATLKGRTPPKLDEH